MPSADRVLTPRELNRALLARQLLLVRKRLSPIAVIEHLVGMQAQWPAAPYVGVWTRTTDFRRETLEHALARGGVVKATVMRQTLHLVAKRLAPSVRKLADAGPVMTAEALAHLERAHGLTGLDARRAWRAARAAAHLVHHYETALWRARPEGRFVACDEPDDHTPVQARAEILRRYLAAFGPASRKDISAWGMLPMPMVDRALALLVPLRRFRDERGRELLDVPRAPLPPEDVPAPVRFLPKWDNVLLAHADRSRILPDEQRKLVIGKNGDVAQTVLVDGFVAGTWRVEKQRVVVEALPGKKLTREVTAEAKRLEEWLA